MEVTSLCIRLLVNVLLLLTAQSHISSRVHKADAAFLHVDPNRLQLFDNESISLHCAGFDGPTWRVMTNTSQWETSTGSLNIKPAFVRHSGEYWCENGDGERSNTVDVIVTAGDVILESPALPVMEQQTATLHCRRRATSKNPPADFFKDGRFIKTGYTGYMTIPNISMSDEGLYSCSISGAGGSAESRLAVTVGFFSSTSQMQSDIEESSSTNNFYDSILLPLVFAMPCVALLLLGIGLLLCWRHRVGCFSSTSGTDSVSGQESDADPHTVTYAVVTKHRKRGEPGASSGSAGLSSSAGTKMDSRVSSVVYSSLNLKRSQRAGSQRGA